MTNIKEITLSTGKWLAVTTADYFYEDSLNLDSEPDEDGNIWLCYQVPDGFNEKSECIKLPSGNTYTIVGKASEISWQEKVSIIEKEHDGSGSLRWWYKLYPAEKGMEQWTRDPDESFDTLLRAYGLNPETTIIIKQDYYEYK